ncbi:DUF4229 domain-containing protein [Krasilnikovia sp. MM14-A1004]|uniref:DUF4229 domain-containing protein n=1 Tax=Krasilnikovia sp. MM14-A1004 TaxID=3373541 RepID=UPI00399D1FAC
MSPSVKYTLGRLGLFLVVFVLLLPVPLNLLVRAMIALVASAGFSYFLLARWRNEMAEQLAGAADRRKAEKNRLRAALAGDEAAAAAGDRAAPTGDGAASNVVGPGEAAASNGAGAESAAASNGAGAESAAASNGAGAESADRADDGGVVDDRAAEPSGGADVTSPNGKATGAH